MTSAWAVVATTAEMLARTDVGEEMLEEYERRRLDRVRVPGRRDDVLAARLLLRLCASRVTARPPGELAIAQHCAACGRHGHGRPYLRDRPDVGISLSHADGLVAAAAGPGAVGIDVEPAGRSPGPAPVLARLLPDAVLRAAASRPDPDRALLRQWVRREALLKAGHRDDGTDPAARPGLPWVDGPGRHRSRRGGLHVLDWTDRRRSAVATVAGAVPVRVLAHPT